jgi:hypothetical protein
LNKRKKKNQPQKTSPKNNYSKPKKASSDVSTKAAERITLKSKTMKRPAKIDKNTKRTASE